MALPLQIKKKKVCFSYKIELDLVYVALSLSFYQLCLQYPLKNHCKLLDRNGLLRQMEIETLFA